MFSEKNIFFKLALVMIIVIVHSVLLLLLLATTTTYYYYITVLCRAVVRTVATYLYSSSGHGVVSWTCCSGHGVVIYIDTYHNIIAVRVYIHITNILL